MAIEVTCAKDEDIGNAFLKAVSESGARGCVKGANIYLPHDLAHDLAEYIVELIVERGATEGLFPDLKRIEEIFSRLAPMMQAKSLFFQLAGHYVQVNAIATILQKPNGDVAMVTVNNGVINIDALTWQTMREAFESVIELKLIKVSSLVKGAS